MNGKSMRSMFEAMAEGEERRERGEEDEKTNFPAAPLVIRKPTHQRQ